MLSKYSALKNEKWLDEDSLPTLIQSLHASEKKIVFTNGCFDILHPGHLHYLRKAKDLGDMLILGLNSDDSVSRLKGPQRPINNLEFRAAMLAGLESVDYIISFDQDTPLQLIKTIKPHILVKGGDYKKSDIVGAAEVEALGGKVHVIEFLDKHSTTQIIEKIKSL